MKDVTGWRSVPHRSNTGVASGGRQRVNTIVAGICEFAKFLNHGDSPLAKHTMKLNRKSTGSVVFKRVLLARVKNHVILQPLEMQKKYSRTSVLTVK